jgi:hypothetical protein
MVAGLEFAMILFRRRKPVKQFVIDGKLWIA